MSVLLNDLKIEFLPAKFEATPSESLKNLPTPFVGVDAVDREAVSDPYSEFFPARAET